MAARHIVVGQHVIEGKVIRARQFRREMTPAERRLWECLRAKRLNGLHFRRQQVIDGFIVDFYCHEAALVVEVDGPSHAAQAGYDLERDRILQAHGLHVLHVTNTDVLHDCRIVLCRITEILAQPQPSPDLEYLEQWRRSGRGRQPV